MRTMIPLGKIMRIIEGDLRDPRQCVLVIEEDGLVRVVTELEADAVRKGWEITEEVPGLEGVAERIEAGTHEPVRTVETPYPLTICLTCGGPLEAGECKVCGTEW